MAELPRPGPDPRAGGGGGGGDVASVNGETGVVVLDHTDVGAAADDDARLTDDRDPTVHATSHNDGGADEITVAESQVTGLSAALAAKATPADITAAVDSHDGSGTAHPDIRALLPLIAGTDTVATFVLVDADFDPLTDPAPLTPGVPAYVFSGVDAMTGQDLEEVVRAPATFAGLWDGNTDPADLGDPGEWQLLTPHAYEAKVGDGWFSRGFFDFRTGTPTPLGKPWVTDFTTPRFGYISPLSLFDSPVFELKFEETTEQVPGTEASQLRIADPVTAGLDAGSTNVLLALTEIAATLAAKVTGDGITDVVALTQAEYDGLTPDAETLYVITDA